MYTAIRSTLANRYTDPARVRRATRFLIAGLPHDRFEDGSVNVAWSDLATWVKKRADESAWIDLMTARLAYHTRTPAYPQPVAVLLDDDQIKAITWVKGAICTDSGRLVLRGLWITSEAVTAADGYQMRSANVTGLPCGLWDLEHIADDQYLLYPRYGKFPDAMVIWESAFNAQQGPAYLNPAQVYAIARDLEDFHLTTAGTAPALMRGLCGPVAVAAVLMPLMKGRDNMPASLGWLNS